MQYTPKNWLDIPYDSTEVVELQKALKVHPIFCQLLIQRGIKTFDAAKRFFRPQWAHLEDPFMMLGMEQAALRLIQATVKKETIVIYGDYDVDGTTAVSLVYNFLRKYHQQLLFYIPDRYTEDYGLSNKGVEWAAQ